MLGQIRLREIALIFARTIFDSDSDFKYFAGIKFNEFRESILSR